ncbi:hypothetical protein B0H63DRAFT_462954 [Podospora didyma]|uniref:Uncharacterized protein n=1 Tax=Podospora didyma TaxID=330526 RepID=A0AAE0U9A9_9PEZI|nr:hypothetical protein B0H63DRAFT_462954 [Podospora didyma]
MPDILPESLPTSAISEKCSTASFQSNSKSETVHEIRPIPSPQDVQALRSGSEENNPLRFRRYQTLHVFKCFRTPTRGGKISCSSKSSLPYYILRSIFAIGVAIFLMLCGAFGTSALLICTAISDMAARLLVAVERPAGYLENTEAAIPTGCMLAAAHQNATEWYLFIGDRAIVDSLLNKTMFWIPDSNTSRLVGYWLQLAHFIQIAAMTFAAGQKGWDGVSLMVLVAVNRLFERFSNGNSKLAERWLAHEGVGVDLKSFEFSGRTLMLGAVQLFSGSQTTSWMDDIVTPHPRRDAWLRYLVRGEEPDHNAWSPGDLARIEMSAKLSIEAARVLRTYLMGTLEEI